MPIIRIDRLLPRHYNIYMNKAPSFYEKVYRITAQIPAGFVMTYGQIALLLGSPRASRQVGQAMCHAPEGRALPCHRVVNRFGELAPEYAFAQYGGKAYQRALLEDDGITFLADGRIDLTRHLWDAGSASIDFSCG